MNKEVSIKQVQQRLRPKDSEVTRLFGDNSKLRELTSWEPSFGGLDGFRAGLITTIKWFREAKTAATSSRK